jgi:hypothetical protein
MSINLNISGDKLMKKTIIAVLCSALPFAANANNDDFYFSAGYTSVNVDLGLSNTTVNGLTLTVDEDDTAGTFMVGYNVNDNFAIEGGVITSSEAGAAISGNISGSVYGSTAVVNGRIDIKAKANESYLLGGKFKLPMSKELDLNARAGLMWWDIDYSASYSVNGTYAGRNITASETFAIANSDGSDMYLGLGASYKVSEDVSINADYMRTEMDDADIDAYTLSATMRF